MNRYIYWILIVVMLTVFGCGGDAANEEDSSSDGDSDSDSDSDSDGDSDTDGDTDADGDSDSDSDTDGDADSDGDSDTDADTDTDGDSDTDGDTDSDGDTDTDGDSDSDSDGDSDSDADSETEAPMCAAPLECHSDCSRYEGAVEVPGLCEGEDEGDVCCDMAPDTSDGDADTDSDTDSDSDSDTDSDTETGSDGDTDSDSDADGDPDAVCPYVPSDDPMLGEDVITFNNDGAWTWYNDERAVVDAEAGKIVVGSANSGSGMDVVIYDIASGASDKKTLGSLSYADDHNNPGIVITSPGEYFAAYAHHNKECNSYWATYTGGSWSSTVTHGWEAQGCPWGSSGSHVTYNNVYKMSAEGGRLYNFVRSVDTSPTFLYSDDDGQSWTWGGRITSSEQLGYNAGYYRWFGNGVDRIDFLATESHCRDSNTSVYHGYVMGEKTYDSFGNEIDGNIYDSQSPRIQEFTKIFSANDQLDGVTMSHLWNHDVASYADGTVAVIWQARGSNGGCTEKDNGCDPNHQLAYSRFDGSGWTSTRLVKGGDTLYRDRSEWWEEDYLGGGTLDPDNPHIIYISTNVDPRNESQKSQYQEIWKGVTCDDGATFTWEPITQNSPHENCRPHVAKWSVNNTALFWWSGPYQTAQVYDTSIVGIISQQ